VLKSEFCAQDLPFDLNCGFVGYFGYEMKSECDSPPCPFAAETEEREQGLKEPGPPDAAFMLADRLIAFDHHLREMYLLTLTGPSAQEISVAEAWLQVTAARIAAVHESSSKADNSPQPSSTSSQKEKEFADVVAATIRNCAESTPGFVFYFILFFILFYLFVSIFCVFTYF